MSPDLEHELFERFDDLYRGRHLPDTENLMPYGFCCGDGWYEIIATLSQQIQVYGQEHPEVPLLVMQVKQKFGQLRFYLNSSNSDLNALIAAAMEQSSRTCELTGQPGVLCRRGSDYQTLCLEKAQELGFEPLKSNG